MTTLAGRKIRAFREGQRPILTRTVLAARLGVRSGSTVQGWEVEGKRPDDPELVAKLHADGICERGDWFLPAECPDCRRPSDGEAVAACGRKVCAMRERFGAEAGVLGNVA